MNINSLISKMTKISYARLTLYLCCFSALLYNSWPLGYILNNSTAHNGLASDLEKVGQPYFWLFILGDVLTGLAVLVAAVIFRLKLWPKQSSLILNLAIYGLAMFGLFTAVCALLPSECSITPVFKCGVHIRGGISLDALTSTLAAIGLFISLVSFNILSHHYNFNSVYKLLNKVLLTTWTLSGLLFVYLALNNGLSHLMQQILLVIFGLALVLIGLNNYEIAISKRVKEN